MNWQNASTRLIAAFLFGTMAGWFVFALWGDWAVGWMDGLLGERISRAGEGKFNDSRRFIEDRVCEALILWTWFALFLVAFAAAERWMRDRSMLWRLATVVGTAVVFLQLWFAIASGTVLFWMFFWQGDASHNLVRFEIKRNLLEDDPDLPQVILMGSSQIRAQIDEQILNAELRDLCFTTDLNYPGSKCFDTWVVWNQIRDERPEYLICYLSELDMFSGAHGPAPAYFLDWSMLIRALRETRAPLALDSVLRHGLAGSTFPLLRMREPTAARILGPALLAMGQERHNASLEEDLSRRAAESAGGFHVDSNSDLQKECLFRLAHDCQKDGTVLVLLTGRLHPELSRRLPAEMRIALKETLVRLEREFPNVVVAAEDEMVPQSTTDYVDLTHINEKAQERYSLWLAAWMKERLFRESGPRGGDHD